MHRRGVIHRDITPANIVLSSDGTPCLVDFALATSLAEIRPEFTHHTEIVGTLAYLAPEQTGRTGRPVDQRADLYALGATLYELATGEPPFGTGDPLRLIHDHLARMPVPPGAVNPRRARGAVRDHHAPAGKGTGQPVPDGGRRGLRPGAGPGRPGARGSGRTAGRRARRPGAAAAAVAAGGRDAEVAVLRAAFDGCVGGPVPRGADQRGAGGGQDGAGRRAAAGGDRPRRLVRGGQVRRRTGGTWSSTLPIRRSARWAGCCWPSRTMSWRGCGRGSWRRPGRTRGC